MSVILLPNRLRQQPQYPAPLDAAHWAAKDIVFAFSAGRGFRDGKHPGLVGTLTTFTTFATGAKGKYLENTVPGNNAYFANHADHDTLGGVTILGLVQPSSVSGQMTVASKDAAGGGTNTPFGLLLDAGGVVSLNRANAGFRVWNGVAGIAAGQVAVVAATQGADISVPPKFYIDGVFDTGSPVNQFGGSGSGAPIATTEGIKLTANTSFNNRFLGGIYGVLVLNKEYSATQVAELSRNLWAIWKAPARRVWAVASSDVTVALSGLSLSSARGSLTPNNSVSLSGQSVTSARGTLSPSVGSTVALTGLGLASARGSLSPALSVTLSGQVLTGSRGTLIPATQIALTGQSLASAKGTLNVSGTASAALTGQSLTAGQGTLSPSSSSSIALTGQAIAAARGALSPANAVTLPGQYVTSAQGSVAVSTAIALSGESVTIGQGSLAIVGDVSIQLSGLQLSIDVGDLVASTGALSSIVERTAIFHPIVERTVIFQRSKSVTVKFN